MRRLRRSTDGRKASCSVRISLGIGIASELRPQQVSYMAGNEAQDWIWRKEGRVET